MSDLSKLCQCGCHQRRGFFHCFGPDCCNRPDLIIDPPPMRRPSANQVLREIEQYATQLESWYDQYLPLQKSASYEQGQNQSASYYGSKQRQRFGSSDQDKLREWIAANPKPKPPEWI